MAKRINPRLTAAVKALGYVSYGAYLNSQHWKTIRLLVLERDCFQCQKCGAKEYLQVHHLTYARLGNERLSDLATWCRICHVKRHRRKRRPKAKKKS